MQPPHTSRAFDRDIDGLRTQLLTMAGHVETAIGDAAGALESRDEALAARVVEGDAAIDALEDAINAEVVRIIALRQPAAGDLRTVITVMKMSGDLERVGDYAKNLAKRVPMLGQGPDVAGAAGAIRRLSVLVKDLLRDAKAAFEHADAEAAYEVLLRDVEIDEMTGALFRQFLTHMMEDPRSITACMHYLFIAKNLERMGDHVTEICEQLIYLETGERPEVRPKGPSTAFLDSPHPDGAA